MLPNPKSARIMRVSDDLLRLDSKYAPNINAKERKSASPIELLEASTQ